MVGDVKPDCKEMWNLTTVGDMPTPRAQTAKNMYVSSVSFLTNLGSSRLFLAVMLVALFLLLLMAAAKALQKL